MAFSFRSFSSGSSGNSYLVKTDTTALLVDAGISAKKIMEGLAQANIGQELLKGLLLTHEHGDHIKSAHTLLKKIPDLKAFANEKTLNQVNAIVNDHQKALFSTGDRFQIGDIEVKTFQVSHDAADPVGFSFFAEGKQISIVTDTGCVNERLFEEIMESDLLVLEANHDVEMLKYCRYPWSVKQRILGEQGHLSNEAAGKLLVKLLKECQKQKNVILAHLSRENNFPEMALQTVKNILEDADYHIGKRISLNAVVRDQISMQHQT